MDHAKDLVIAILGGSVALAGLLLVFSGFLFAQAESFPPEHTDDATINRYKSAAGRAARKLGHSPLGN